MRIERKWACKRQTTTAMLKLKLTLTFDAKFSSGSRTRMSRRHSQGERGGRVEERRVAGAAAAQTLEELPPPSFRR